MIKSSIWKSYDNEQSEDIFKKIKEICNVLWKDQVYIWDVIYDLKNNVFWEDQVMNLKNREAIKEIFFKLLTTWNDERKRLAAQSNECISLVHKLLIPNNI